ncbi:glucose dehydrogenase [FAD, quinone]-like [Belonocnema kinseyi]|uniref:glucose dehydrogenase [FAD, quinone]-like n=1 Tax=Belonocnema kinseyi TaxID=2817044 RepID=UPI00143D9D73|nr:glucose dehydrogenase [FAD, quinone]-like [Belonocnema kinseyi]
MAFVANLFSSSRDRNSNIQPEPDKYDFIIVGAGSAGCVIANRLTEIKKWNVLLLEAGVEEPQVTEVPAFRSLIPRSNIEYNYQIQSEKMACKSKSCSLTPGKLSISSVMGGSSAVNGMVYARGNREDYDNWEQLGNTGWSYEDVLPYFKKSEDNRDKDIVENNPGYHGIGGYQGIQRLPCSDSNGKIIIEALQEIGYDKIDASGEKQIGVMDTQYISKDGMRQSTNIAFIRPIRKKRSNLFIKTESTATRVLIDPKTKTAYGVEYISDGISKFAYVKKEVILSASTFESPKLLMLSGIGPADDLKQHNINVIHELPVGRHMHNHIKVGGLEFSFPNESYWTLTTLEKMRDDVNYYLKSHSGPLSSRGPAEAMAFLRTKYEENEKVPDIQLQFGSHSPQYIPQTYYDSFGVSIFLLNPKSRGYMTLNDTDPIWGNPLIYSGYFSAESDFDVMVEGIRMALKIADTKAFKKNGFKLDKTSPKACKNLNYGTERYWKCHSIENARIVHHHVSTCKMGPKSDPEAVVDPRLRVHGVYGLRVADASIMPHVIRGNPLGPVIMIAEKASDIIKKDWLFQ